MSDLRFRLNVPRAGSAARLSEQEKAEQPGMRPKSVQIRAGSSALDAETRKRDEISRASSAGFTMRAQNGRIVHTERGIAPDATPVAEDHTATSSSSTKRTEQDTLHLPSTAPAKIHTTQRSLAPSLLGTLAGRLNSAVLSLLGTSPSNTASRSGDDDLTSR